MPLARCQKCMAAGCMDDVHQTEACPHGHETGKRDMSWEPSNVLRDSMTVIRARELAGEMERAGHWQDAEIAALLRTLADQVNQLLLAQEKSPDD